MTTEFFAQNVMPSEEKKTFWFFHRLSKLLGFLQGYPGKSNSKISTAGRFIRELTEVLGEVQFLKISPFLTHQLKKNSKSTNHVFPALGGIWFLISRTHWLQIFQQLYNIWKKKVSPNKISKTWAKNIWDTLEDRNGCDYKHRLQWVFSDLSADKINKSEHFYSN